MQVGRPPDGPVGRGPDDGATYFRWLDRATIFAELLAEQSLYPVVKSTAKMVLKLIKFYAKKPDIKANESRDQCAALANVLQRVDDLLSSMEKNKAEKQDAVKDVCERVKSIEGLMKAYSSKNQLAAVVSLPLFNQRVEEATEAFELATRELNVSLFFLFLTSNEVRKIFSLVA